MDLNKMDKNIVILTLSTAEGEGPAVRSDCEIEGLVLTEN
jgi:hypothetical protein